jgi:hypothetical protein
MAAIIEMNSSASSDKLITKDSWANLSAFSLSPHRQKFLAFSRHSEEVASGGLCKKKKKRLILFE